MTDLTREHLTRICEPYWPHQAGPIVTVRAEGGKLRRLGQPIIDQHQIDLTIDTLEQLDADVWVSHSAMTVDAFQRMTAERPNARGATADYTHTSWAVVDLDIAGPAHKTEHPLPPDVESAMKIIDQLPEPTLTVNTGNGVHCWWRIDTHHLTDNRSDLELRLAEVHRIVAARATELGWHVDTTVDQIARIWRVAGTHNHKTDPPKPVTITASSASRLELPEPAPQPTPATAPTVDHRQPIRLNRGNETGTGAVNILDAFNACDLADILPGWEHTTTTINGRTVETWLRPGSTADKSLVRWPGEGIQVFTDAIPGLPAGAHSVATLYAALNGRTLSDLATELYQAGRGNPTGLPGAAVNRAKDLVGWEPANTQTPSPVGEWRDPEPLATEPVVPAWPVHVLPAWMADHINQTAEQLQVPPDLCAQFALGALSAACVGHTRTVAGPWVEPLNLYLATAMPSGAGKSPAEKAMTRPLRDWEAKKRKSSQVGHDAAVAQREMLQQRRRNLITAGAKAESNSADLEHVTRALNDIDVPPVFRRIADDITPEQLAIVLAEQGERLAILSTEADLLDMASGLYTKGRLGNISIYLKAFSGDTHVVDRKGSGGQPGTQIHLDAPLLVVGMAMQPTVLNLATETGEQLEGRGFLARFMFSTPKHQIGHRDRSRFLTAPTNEHAAAIYSDRLVDLAARCEHKVGDTHVDPDAAHHFADWLQDHETQMQPGGDLAAVHAWITKCESSVWRVAGLLHLADGNNHQTRISIDTIRRAIEIGDYWTAHALAMADSGSERALAKEAEKILRTVARTGDRTCKPRDIWVPHRARYSKVTDLIPVLAHLEEKGWLRVVEGTLDDIGVRRVTVEIEFHPSTIDEWSHQKPTARLRALRALDGADEHTPRDGDHSERVNARIARNGHKEVFQPFAYTPTTTHTPPADQTARYARYPGDTPAPQDPPQLIDDLDDLI